MGSVYFFLFYVLKGLTDPSHLRQSLTIQVSSSYIPRLLFRFILFRSLQFSGHAKCTKALRSVLLTHRSCSAPRIRIYIRRFITVPFFHDSKNEKKTKKKKSARKKSRPRSLPSSGFSTSSANPLQKLQTSTCTRAEVPVPASRRQQRVLSRAVATGLWLGGRWSSQSSSRQRRRRRKRSRRKRREFSSPGERRAPIRRMVRRAAPAVGRI